MHLPMTHYKTGEKIVISPEPDFVVRRRYGQYDLISETGEVSGCCDSPPCCRLCTSPNVFRTSAAFRISPVGRPNPLVRPSLQPESTTGPSLNTTNTSRNRSASGSGPWSCVGSVQ